MADSLPAAQRALGVVLVDEVGLVVEQRLTEARHVGPRRQDDLVGRDPLALLHLLEVAGTEGLCGLASARVELDGVVAVEVVERGHSCGCSCLLPDSVGLAGFNFFGWAAARRSIKKRCFCLSFWGFWSVFSLFLGLLAVTLGLLGGPRADLGLGCLGGRTGLLLGLVGLVDVCPGGPCV